MDKIDSNNIQDALIEERQTMHSRADSGIKTTGDVNVQHVNQNEI